MDSLKIMKQQIKDKILSSYKSGGYIYKDCAWLQKYEREKRIDMLDMLVAEGLLKSIFYCRCESIDCDWVDHMSYDDFKAYDFSKGCCTCGCALGVRKEYQKI